jgi:hypothetical protein
MQPFVRQHPIQARNCEQDEEQQNEDGDNNLHECETALMSHSGILRRASQITIWHWNTGPWPQVLPPTKYPKIVKCGDLFAWQAQARHRFGLPTFPVADAFRIAFPFRVFRVLRGQIVGTTSR